MKRLRNKQRRHAWTKDQLALLRRQYPCCYTQKIAKALHLELDQVYRKAHQLGLRKSAAFRRMRLADEGRRLRRVGAAHRFQKGIVPANKGLRRPGWYSGRMRETQFKKGQFPVNKDPDFYVLGALRINTDGYIDMRVSFEHGAKGWRGLHLILWEDAHGPMPKGHCLRFRDGDRLNVCLENLMCIRRGENMLRNSIHNLPKPLVDTIQVLGQLKRRIRNAARRDGITHAVI